MRVDETSYSVGLIQPRTSNRHAVFEVRSRETHDPRVTQTVNLAFDEYGNVLESVGISYGRRPSGEKLCGIADESQDTVKGIQEELQIVYSDNQYTNAIWDVDSHRNPELCGTSNYQITGLPPPLKSLMLRLGDLMTDNSNIFAKAEEVDFEDKLRLSLRAHVSVISSPIFGSVHT